MNKLAINKLRNCFSNNEKSSCFHFVRTPNPRNIMTGVIIGTNTALK